MTTWLQERRDGEGRLEDRVVTAAPEVSVSPRTLSIDSTGYSFGTARSWSKLGVFARVPRDESRVSDRPEADR